MIHIKGTTITPRGISNGNKNSRSTKTVSGLGSNTGKNTAHSGATQRIITSCNGGSLSQKAVNINKSGCTRQQNSIINQVNGMIRTSDGGIRHYNTYDDLPASGTSGQRVLVGSVQPWQLMGWCVDLGRWVAAEICDETFANALQIVGTEDEAALIAAGWSVTDTTAAGGISTDGTRTTINGAVDGENADSCWVGNAHGVEVGGNYCAGYVRCSLGSGTFHAYCSIYIGNGSKAVVVNPWTNTGYLRMMNLGTAYCGHITADTAVTTEKYVEIWELNDRCRVYVDHVLVGEYSSLAGSYAWMTQVSEGFILIGDNTSQGRSKIEVRGLVSATWS